MYIYYLKDKNINGDIMIQNYSIKYENNEEVLYLYLDYNYEFASTNKGKKPFFSQLKRILNNKLINFKGKKIVLVASGIIIGTILLSNPNYNLTNYNDNINYVNQVVLNDFNNLDEYVINVQDNNESNNNIDNKETVKNEEVKYINNNTNDLIENKQQIAMNYKDNNIVENNNQENNKKNDNDNNNINDNDNISENKIIVTVYRNNGNILNIELEEYLIGVVAGEMPASFNIEALKAQAVIARTYTLKSISQNKKLTDTTSTQVYIDNNQMNLKWGKDFNKYYNKIKEAVVSTEGLIITYDNELIDAVYFANSNGYTEDSKEVWGYNIPYLKSVESNWDVNSTRYKKTIFKSYEELSNIMGFNISNDTSIYNILRNKSNRVTSITFDNKTYTGIQLRTLLNLNSADFEIEKTELGLNITTYGYGHGVGMSQYGAQGMANNGYNYESIINYYYQDVKVENNI